MQIAEIDATNEDAPQVAKTYLWNNGAEAESLYYTHDLQKNVTALFGQAAGRRAQYEYDPCGNPINTTGDAAGQNPYRYSSEYHDEDLGLIYYNYRHYNSTDGRWINRDPIAEQGGRNLYGFIGNKVTLYFDFLGEEECSQELEETDVYVSATGNFNMWQASRLQEPTVDSLISTIRNEVEDCECIKN